MYTNMHTRIHQDLNPWLIEVNSSPALATDTPLDHQVCVCVRMYVCMWAYVCMHTVINSLPALATDKPLDHQVYMYVCMCVCAYVYMYVCVYVCICMCVRMYVCIQWSILGLHTQLTHH